jgi:hypothetical protein
LINGQPFLFSSLARLLLLNPGHMKKSLESLNQFINDFNLRQPNGIVCFNAKINFKDDAKTKESEVHIITSDNLATIYFLNLNPAMDGLTDMFDINIYSFDYIDKQFLKVENEKFSLSIFPVTKNC